MPCISDTNHVHSNQPVRVQSRFLKTKHSTSKFCNNLNQPVHLAAGTIQHAVAWPWGIIIAYTVDNDGSVFCYGVCSGCVGYRFLDKTSGPVWEEAFNCCNRRGDTNTTAWIIFSYSCVLSRWCCLHVSEEKGPRPPPLHLICSVQNNESQTSLDAALRSDVWFQKWRQGHGSSSKVFYSIDELSTAAVSTNKFRR